MRDNILATNLSHDDHQSHSADVRALSAHVASSNDLEARLLGSVDVVRDELGLHNLLLDWVPSGLDSQCISELWLG
jgi:hypothetical protein